MNQIQRKSLLLTILLTIASVGCGEKKETAQKPDGDTEKAAVGKTPEAEGAGEVTLAQAQQLVLGKWKVNWEETKKRKSDIDAPNVAMTFEFKKSELVMSAEKQEQTLPYELKLEEGEGNELPKNQFYIYVAQEITRHGKVEIQDNKRIIYTAFKGLPFPLVLDRDDPA